MTQKNSFAFTVGSAFAGGRPQEINIDQGVVMATTKRVAKQLLADKLPKLSEREIARLEGMRNKFDALKDDHFRAEVDGRTVMLFNDGASVVARIEALHGDLAPSLVEKNIEKTVMALKASIERDQLGKAVTYDGGISDQMRMPVKVVQQVLRDLGNGAPDSVEFVITQRAYCALDLNSPTLMEEAKEEVAAAREKLLKSARIEELQLLSSVVSVATNRLNTISRANHADAVRTQQVGHKVGFFEALGKLVQSASTFADSMNKSSKTSAKKGKSGFREMVRKAENELEA